MTAIPRAEYPRPQFVRDDWLCLNGEWEFEVDNGDSGRERGLLDRALEKRITVPFCPESSLSGIGNTDFMDAVWYRHGLTIPAEWAGRRPLLHFQAVDHDATVWVNGVEVARHRGGFTPFSVDIGDVVKPGEEARIVVRARDPHDQPQARGKQAREYENSGCLYTRTTGIWQTVWMEPVPDRSLQRPHITPDVAAGCIRLEQRVTGDREGLRVRATLYDAAGTVTQDESAVGDLSARLDLRIPLSRQRLWAPEDPHLYDLKIELLDADGRVIDSAGSYAGLRSVSLSKDAVLINGRPVFQRLVLDQGYYPDGIMTAPSDAELQADIQRSLDAGFNGARLHQKIFEERFLYHADRLGYLVWSEFPDWGVEGFGPPADNQKPDASFITQWLEAVQRDYSHPSIVGWCPLNEIGQPRGDRIQQLDDVARGMFLAVKAADGTRPVLDASGWAHRVPETDIWDSHDYEQVPEKLAGNHEGVVHGRPHINGPSDRPWSVPYGGQPYFVSEFGGIGWSPDLKRGNRNGAWGYGNTPHTITEFYRRFKGLCQALLRNPRVFGYCYTQLTDVFQEQNGIYTFDRKPKFDLAKLRAAQAGRPAVEQRTRGGGRPGLD